MKRIQSLVRIAWIIIVACIMVFFIIALVVYVKAEPRSVSDLLTRDNTWMSLEELSSMTGNLEEHSYVTKVYEYDSDEEQLDIRYFKKSDDADLKYGIVEDASLAYNYHVECFVYSYIANKQLVRQLWNISVQESKDLLFTKTDTFNVAQDAALFKDLKKSYSKTSMVYITFVRISVKPGLSNIGFYNIIQDTDS